MTDAGGRRQMPPRPVTVAPWAITANGMAVYRIKRGHVVHYVIRDVDEEGKVHNAEFHIRVALDEEARDDLIEHASRSLEDPPRG